MTRRTGRWNAALCLAPLFPLLATAADYETIYTRAEALESITGRVELRRAYTQRLDLPTVECIDDLDFSCAESQTYGLVYEFVFSREFITSDESQALSRSEPRGTLLVALELSRDDEVAFEDSVTKYLRGLTSTGFENPLNDLMELKRPLGQFERRKSLLPAWVCRLREDHHHLTLLARMKSAERTADRTGEIAEPICSEIGSAVEGNEASIFNTLPTIVEQVRHTVSSTATSTLSGTTWSDQLATLPEGVTFTKRPLEPDERGGGIRDEIRGVFRGIEGRFHDVYREVHIPRASLDLLEKPMWATRFRFERVRERFGQDGVRTAEPARSTVIAVFPIADVGSMADQDGPVTVPSRALEREILDKLSKAESPGPKTIRDALRNREIWPREGDWLLVSCYDNGWATFGIAPFADAARVTNAQEACAAIERELGD